MIDVLIGVRQMGWCMEARDHEAAWKRGCMVVHGLVRAAWRAPFSHLQGWGYAGPLVGCPPPYRPAGLGISPR